MNCRQEYQQLARAAPRITDAERAELRRHPRTTTRRSRAASTALLEFGTAGLRGDDGARSAASMNVSCHPPRHAGASRRSSSAEGEERRARAASPSAWTAATTRWSLPAPRPCVMAANGIHRHASLSPCARRLSCRFAVREYGCQAGINVTASRTTPRSITATRSTGPTARSCRPSTPPPSPRSSSRSTFSPASSRMDFDEAVQQGLIDDHG